MYKEDTYYHWDTTQIQSLILKDDKEMQKQPWSDAKQLWRVKAKAQR